MSEKLKNSPLIRNLLDGSLPEVKTESKVDAKVDIPTEVLTRLGLAILGIGAGIAILVILVRKTTQKTA